MPLAHYEPLLVEVAEAAVPIAFSTGQVNVYDCLGIT